MANVVDLFDYRIKRALKKGKKNGSLDVIALYVTLLIQGQLYQNALAKAREVEHGLPES